MTIKHAGYTAGYVVARKTVDPINGFEWTDDVRPAANYGIAVAIIDGLVDDRYSIYALVLADMDEHFSEMVYGIHPAAPVPTEEQP